MSDASAESFERCPRCLRSWDLFPVFRCPNCGTYSCGCCDEPERLDADVSWLAAAWAELRGRDCPACTLRLTDADRVGWIEKPARSR
jgi:hypothetical protein